MKRFLSVFSFFFGVACIVALILFLSQKEYLKQKTLAYLNEQLSRHTGWEVAFEQVELSIPLKLNAEKVVVSNQKHVVLEAHQVALSMNVWELFQQNIVFEIAHFSELKIYDMVHSDHQSQNSDSTGEIPWKNVGLRFNELDINHLWISPKLLSRYKVGHFEKVWEKEQPIRVRGKAVFDPIIRQIVGIFALSSETTSEIQLEASLVQEGNIWNGRLHLKVPPKSFIASEILSGDSVDYGLYLQAKFSETFQLQDGLLHAIFIPESNGNLLSGQLTAGFELNGNDNLQLLSLSGVVGPFLFEGGGKISLETQEVDFFLEGIVKGDDFQNIAKFEKTHFDCHVKGNPLIAILEGNFSFPSIEISDHHFDQVDTKGAFRWDNQQLIGALELNCGYQQKPLAITTSFSTDLIHALNIETAEISFEGQKLAGNCVLSLENYGINGELSGELESSLCLLPISGSSPVDGPFVVKSRLYVEGNKQAIDISLHAPEIKMDEYIFENVSMAIALVDPMHTLEGSFTMSCHKIKSSQWEILDWTINTYMDHQTIRWPFSFYCRDIRNGKYEVYSKGSWEYKTDQLQVLIESLEGNIGSYPYRLSDSATLDWTPDKKNLSPLLLHIQDGLLYTMFEISKEEFHSVVQIRDVPIDIVRVYQQDLPFNGILSLELTLSQSQQGSIGDMQLALKNIQFQEALVSMSLPMDLTSVIRLKDDRIKCSTHVTCEGLHPVDFVAELPVNVSMTPFSVQLLRDKEVALHAIMKGRVETFIDLFLPTPATNFTGDLSVVLDVAGTLNQPQLKGTADLENGVYELLDLGAGVHQGRGHIEISGNTLTLTGLHAVAANQGFITGAGTFSLASEQEYPFNLEFQLNKIPINPMEYVSGVCNGPLAFKGNAHGGVIDGKLTTNSLSITMPESIPELIHTVAVTYINQPNDTKAPTIYKASTSEWPLGLNLQIEVPSAHITGENWKSDWKGSALLSGTTDVPLLNGGCSIINGEYNLNGKAFQINQGTITFAGDPKKKTSIYVIAHRDLDTIRAEVIVKGALTNPSITFRSNPPLPQREILSWILFNSGTSDISPFQGSQLNESITDLSSKNSQPDMLSKFRNQIGIDRIDINREGESANEVSVQVGKYISNGILVSVNRSITAETNRIAIEAALMKHVKVQAEVGDDADAHLMLKWKKDY